MILPNQPLTVTMPFWMWMYFLGWCEANRTPDDTVQVANAVGFIIKATREAME
jgi:hypothetical protein